MSRTTRRPHAASIVANHDYHHIAGVYTERDFVHMPEHGHCFLAVYREPTKIERYKKYASLHLEKGHYRFVGMKSWARREEQKTHRAKHNRLILNFLRGVSEDVIPEKLPKFPSRYW